MTTSKPNILIIISDQMTARLTGAYGHQVVQTPNLEQLCRQGVRFDAAYTNCPLCAPARAAMMSGQYISRLGTYDNGTLFPGDTPTWAHTLRLAGYETVLSGKMHFVGPDQLHGLDRRLTTDIYPAGFKWVSDWEAQRQTGIQNKQGYLASNSGERQWTRQLNYDEEVQSKALDFLRTRQTDTYNRQDPLRPFCLTVSYTHPHSPFQITQEYMDRYADVEIESPVSVDQAREAQIEMDHWLRDYEGISDQIMQDPKMIRRIQQAYFGMVSYVDDKIGELIKTLEELGMKEDTAIIFFSDHGEMLGERGLIEKRNFYENSVRVPLICSFPQKWQSGKRVKELVSLIDLYPTLADFCNQKVPPELDGNSFCDLLENKEDPNQERIVLSEYHGEGVLAPCFMVRKGSLKYVFVHNGSEQLFDLDNDPKELQNLAQNPVYADVKQRLKSLILERFNPPEIEQDVLKKQKRSRYISNALLQGDKTQWDISPQYNGQTMYER